MAGENDSIITFGLELTEETEKSMGEIAGELGNRDPAAANSPAVEQAAPQQDPNTERALALAEKAKEHEAAEQAKLLEHSREHEHEHEGPGQ
jgi:hypothetical protein